MKKWTEIVELQIELNDKTVPDWVKAGLDWDTAILVEVAEAIDSTKWKWWKAGANDVENLKVEAIDILHFLISRILVGWDVGSSSIEYLAEKMEAAHLMCSATPGLEGPTIFTEDSDSSEIVEVLKSVGGNTLNGNPFLALENLLYLFRLLGMSKKDIYSAYMTKNILNHYRQERGYKDADSGYRKVVDGLEDNVHAKKIVELFSQECSGIADLRVCVFKNMDIIQKS